MSLSTESVVHRFPGLEIRPLERVLLVSGQPARVGSRAFDLLVALAERTARVVSKRELIELVWPDAVVEENNLSVQITALRKLPGSGGHRQRVGAGVPAGKPVAGAAPSTPAAFLAPAREPAPADRPRARIRRLVCAGGPLAPGDPGRHGRCGQDHPGPGRRCARGPGFA